MRLWAVWSGHPQLYLSKAARPVPMKFAALLLCCEVYPGKVSLGCSRIIYEAKQVAEPAWVAHYL
jgi:hypothetical protein